MATKTWHVCISGFTQKSNTPHGVFRLWQKLCQYRNSNTAVELFPWNAKWEELAECIFLCSSEIKPKIYLYCYSWGGGWGMTRLCTALQKRGLTVTHVVLSDAVYRHWYLLGSWRALVPWSRITVPSNVRRVTWFRQKESLPSGHNLRAQDPTATYIEKPTWLKLSHVYADDSQAFHDACLKVAAHAHGAKND